MLFIAFLSVSSFASDETDYQNLGYHYEICNSCTSETQFESVAMKETPMGKVVVANLNSGAIYAYKVKTDREPGFEMHWALPTNVPTEASDATQKITSWFNQMEQQSGKPIDRNNPILPILIPSSINGVDTSNARTVITNISSSDAVSNYARQKSIQTLMDLLSTGFKLIVLKLNITVTTQFSYGSTAEWVLVNPLESKQPYRYINGTAKDKNNQPISNNATGAADWGGHENWSNYGSGSGGGTIRTTCKSYTINYSFGRTGTGSVCWYTYTP